MRLALILNGVVQNVAVSDGMLEIEGLTVVQSDQAEIGDTYDGSTFTSPPVDPSSKDALLGYASGVRYSKEIAGITVNGAQVDTSRASQTMIANAYQLASVSGAPSIDYKAKSGWVTVTADQFKDIALAVGAHVQACFATEKSVDAAIQAGSISTLAEIEAASWPTS